MGVKARPAAVEAIRQRVNQVSGHPAMGQVFKCLGAMAAGAVLAGAKVGGVLLPLPLALAAALGLGLESFAAYAGGCLGYAVLWGLDAGLEPMAAGLLAEACLCIFGDQLSRDNRWFAPGAATLFTILVGFLFLLEQRFAPAAVWRLALRAAAAGGGAVLFRRALEGAALPRLCLLAALVSGLSALAPGGFALGLPLGCLLSAGALGTPQTLPVAALCGMALELQGQGGAAVVLPLAAMVASTGQGFLARTGLWLLSVLAGVLLTGAGPMLLTAAILSAALVRLFPWERLFGLLETPARVESRQMELAAGLFSRLGQCLALTRHPQADPDTATVFDHAAERVCRLCSRFDFCWKERLGETCTVLDRAAPAMMTRGKALREDLAPSFLSRCLHVEGFLTAINHELDDLACRRQARARLRESRTALTRQYEILAAALSRPSPREEETGRFVPELCCRGQSRDGDALSGDQTMSFRCGRRYYILLCDGMGAGRAARAEAGAAAAVLRLLLLSGAKPREAMEFLNDLYLLRDDGAFSTVDLAEIDLMTGEAALYKWGAAPSYLKKKGTVEKIGTASPPPGIGAGEEHRPEEAKLSLARGEMLVLVSDGAGGEAAERFLRQYAGTSPKELASGIVSCSQAGDDRTAAVLALRRRIAL